VTGTRRRITVFTGGRADLWPLRPVIDVLRADAARAEVVVVAAGTHLSTEFGATAAEIGLPDETVELIDCGITGDDPHALTEALAATAVGVSEVLGRRRPHVLVVLGDRPELLAVCAAATLHGVPIAHIHGGEVTEGAVDDAVRHAVTKLSHLHFCAAEPYAARVIASGEEPWRVHVTGAPGLDRLASLAKRFSRRDVEAAIGAPLRPPVALLTYHPPTLDPLRTDAELEAAIAGCAPCPTVLATYPGADPGSVRIVARLHRLASERPGVVVVPSLGERYPAALAACDVVVGNSSRGVIEAPSFGCPTVNVGDRQRGRLRASTVIDVPGEPDLVRRAVDLALSDGFRRSTAGAANPYGDGRAGPRIAAVLLEQELDGLRRKRDTLETLERLS
jgi:UDP-hydrolysing UDP-N-acetyl-D-glucosamine 2-epimerase